MRKKIVEDEKTGARAMFNENQIEDLTRLFTLFSREAHTLEYLKDSMSKLIREIGTNIVKDQENLKAPKLFVQAVLDTRSKFNHIVQVSFKQDRTFARALKEALEYFINLDSRSAQYLSLHIDDMFRKPLKDIPSDELDKRLNNVISIFRYLQDKDVFEDFYKKHLAARLLTGQSKDIDIEKKMITELKGECGHQYTARVEGMFKDMDISKTIMKHFKNFRLKSGRVGGSEISVTVLTSGFWPIPVVPKCILPKTAQHMIDEFTGFYLQKHSGRRLTWQHNLGSAEVRATFEKGKKEFLLHTYQMCIMMLYNNTLSLTFEEIKKATNIPDQELERHLLSLAHPKVRLLKKTPNNKNIANDHVFAYNLQYTSKLKRVKIPLLSTKQPTASSIASPLSPPVKKDLPDSITETRKSRVEVTIVRIMRERKSLEHKALIDEVTSQLTNRFPVEPRFIKKRIESLIEREYLQKDKDNSGVYHYVA